RHRLDRRLDDPDLAVEPGCGDGLLCKLDVTGQRVERDGAQSVRGHEPDRVACVARADVDEELSRLRAERGEGVEQPVRSPRLETPRELFVESRIAGPELVELLDRRHYAPPAIAG